MQCRQFPATNYFLAPCGAGTYSSNPLFALLPAPNFAEANGLLAPIREIVKSCHSPSTTPPWLGSVSTLRRNVMRGFGARHMDVALRPQLNMWVRGEGRVCVSFLP
jgi:hypothetical protein